MVELAQKLGEAGGKVGDRDPAALARSFAQQVRAERNAMPETIAIGDAGRVHPQRRRAVGTNGRTRPGAISGGSDFAFQRSGQRNDALPLPTTEFHGGCAVSSPVLWTRNAMSFRARLQHQRDKSSRFAFRGEGAPIHNPDRG